MTTTDTDTADTIEYWFARTPTNLPDEHRMLLARAALATLRLMVNPKVQAG